MAKPFLRTGIPDQSIFTASVAAKDGDINAPFVANGHIRLPNGTEVDWPEPALKRGRRRTLRSPAQGERTYGGLIQLDFAAQTTVIVRMLVVKPDGSKHSYEEEVTGSAGSVDRTLFSLAMAL